MPQGLPRRYLVMGRVGSSPGTILACLMEVGTGSAGAGLLSLILVAALSSPSLQKSLPAAYRDHEGPRGGTGLIQCGEYSNQVLPNGRCKIVATLPQGDEQRCPDMFRCTDEVSYWLHENEERKQQILEQRELISELQEELRNHRHRIKVLELQVKGCPSQTPPLRMGAHGPSPWSQLPAFAGGRHPVKHTVMF